MKMSSEQMSRNPSVDYTRYGIYALPGEFLTHKWPYRPDLISLVFSDVGILTPEGVSQYLVGMFAG